MAYYCLKMSSLRPKFFELSPKHRQGGVPGTPPPMAGIGLMASCLACIFNDHWTVIELTIYHLLKKAYI